MTFTGQVRPLERAPLISLRWVARWSGPPVVLGPMRMANASTLYIWRLCITWRMPWLEGPARVLHPECFDRSTEGGR